MRQRSSRTDLWRRVSRAESFNPASPAAEKGGFEVVAAVYFVATEYIWSRHPRATSIKNTPATQKPAMCF